MIAVILLSANLLIAGCSVLVLGLLVVRTPLEERQLTARFGDAYRDYIDSTPQFVPRFWPRSRSRRSTSIPR
jgi:protein-S-isoprenylcysteine O-methyltransferase Ste14